MALKQRLVGGAILMLLFAAVVALAVVILGGRDPGLGKSNIPLPPPGLETRVLPLEQRAAEAQAALQQAQAPTPAPLPAAAPTGVPDQGAPPPPPSLPASPKNAPVATAATGPKAQAWVVQLGSFASEANATALRDTLRGLGHAAFIERTAGGDGPAYRVRIGPELSRAQADALKTQIEQQAKLPAMVLSYP